MKESYQIPSNGPHVAFKEWQSICDVLGKGKQSLILRKGGIAEGREGFAFKHQGFFLFPTLFHHQWDAIKPDVVIERSKLPDNEERETVRIELYAEVVSAKILADWASVDRLKSFHVWKDDVVRERFEYNDQGSLHLAIVRVYRLVKPWVLPYQRNFGGCRSWLELPCPENACFQVTPVIPDEEFRRFCKELNFH